MILIIAQFHTPQTPFELEETITMMMILIMRSRWYIMPTRVTFAVSFIRKLLLA